jgi:hypothetical protein
VWSPSRRHFVATLLALPALPALGQPTTAPGPVVVSHEPTELAWILAGLSPLDQGGDSLNRGTPYWRAAEAWFSAHRGHAAITALGADFNLPRLIGNAANYRFGDGPRLIRAPGTRPLWSDADGDLFTRHLPLIDAFARDSRATLFLAQQCATFAEARRTLAAAADFADMQAWLERQFTARPARIQVYVSPLTGSWNFTSLDPLAPSLWVPAVEAPPSKLARLAIALGIFTEMDHNYVNPATTRLGAAAHDFMTADAGWATAAAWSDYDGTELVANEYMTFAVFVAYAHDRSSGEDLRRIDAATRDLMQRRGFARFDRFVDELLLTRSATSATLEASYPTVLARLRTRAS